MKKSIKTALLFSTLIIGAVETPNVINQTSGSAQFVAHADSTVDNSSTSNIKKLDPEIQQILLQNVNQNEFKNYGSADQITNGDLSNLQSINYTASGSESIKTLDNINPDIFPLLTSISISNVDMSSVKDLSPLAQLTNLNAINLTGANITSDQLNTLGQWSDSSLNNLDLSNNNISSLDFLKDISIPNVKNINISHNKVSDFTPVKNQKWLQLATLKADFNNISDISPIADVNWPNLTVLSVKNNQISDISPISSANWPNLDQLYADNNNISDINSFANTNWHKLSTISANGNHISNVASLKDKKAKFPNLTKFYVSNNNINDISWMSGYNFDSSSNAKQEIVNATANVVKTTDGKPVIIKFPISINDISLDNNLLASPDSNGQNIIVDNDYITGDYDQTWNTTSPDLLVGNDGKPYTINDDNGKQTSNGLYGIKLNSDNGSTKYTFGFTSTLGQGFTGHFAGSYNLIINWGENTTQSKDVNVTVKYVDQNGKEISTPQTKKISFTETGFKPDDTDQQITWNNDWKDVDGTSYSFTSPNINGYEDPSEVQVSGTVDHDSTDIVKTVTYKTIPVSSSASSNSSESQSASSADSQSQSSASSSTSSDAQSSSASSQQASSSSAAKEANNASSEHQTSSAAKASSETQSSSAAKDANSSSSQSQSSSATKEVNSSSSEPQSSSVAKEVSSSSSESQSSSATKEASSSAQSIPASNQSTASSSSSVSSSSSSTNESSATPTTPSKSAVVAPKHSKSRTPKHSNNNGTPKTDNVQSKQVTAKKVETPSSSEHKNAKSLPQTGDSTNQNALVALGSVLVAISATMIAFVLRRKNK